MMKKFILKSGLFALPFIIAYLLNIIFYKPNKDEGELVRLGYFYANPYPKSVLIKQHSFSHKKCNYVSEIDLAKKHHFDIVTIGDCFSGRGIISHKNFLTQKGFSVLHVDRFISKKNPIQKLVELTNSDFFNRIHTDYVVLEFIGRSVFRRTKTIDFSKSDYLNSSKIERYKKERKPILQKREEAAEVHFFSDATIKIPFINIQYTYTSKPKFSNIFKIKTNKNDLFTEKTSNILLKNIGTYNNRITPKKLEKAIKTLDKISELLQKKGIQLIVLTAPDKYDLYYPYIKDNQNFTPPVFYKHYNQLPKKYVDVNSYEILKKELSKNKDVYYYDDYRWSPVASKIIADEIYRLIKDK